MASKKSTPPFKRVLGWGEVKRVVPEGIPMFFVLQGLADSQISHDSLASQNTARRILCELLVRAEDLFEGLSPMASRQRAAMRDVRRRLELELWP